MFLRKRERVIRVRLIPPMLAMLLTASVSSGTLVVYQWTPGVIYLATDSLTAKVGSDQIKGITACKIHQVGNTFFTIVGVNDDPAIKVDLVAIATKAAQSTGQITEIFTRFEVLAQPQVERIMLRNATGQLGFTEQQRVDIVFVDRLSHTLIYKEYLRNADGTTTSLPRKIYRAPGKPMSDPDAVGVYAEARASLTRDSALSRLDGVSFIVGFIQAQIDYETYRLRTLRTIPRVGVPICVLQISGGKANWVPGHQGMCPDIK